MKIAVEHYDELVAMLDELKVNNDLDHIEKAYVGEGFSLKRFRWDVLFAVPKDMRHEWFNKIYEYANDNHIDTALRKYFGHGK